MGVAGSSHTAMDVEVVLSMIAEYFHSRNFTMKRAFNIFFDINQDGYCTWDEFIKGVNVCLENVGRAPILQGKLWPIFQRFDLNQDGKMSLEEFQRAFPPGSAIGGRGGRAVPVRTVVPDNIAADAVISRIAASIIRTGYRPEDIFYKLDSDRSRKIERSELEKFVRSFEANLSRTEMEAVFRRFDKDNSSSIDMDEFFNALANANGDSFVVVEDCLTALGKKLRHNNYSMNEAFSLFDANGNYTLSRDEWSRAIKLLARDISDRDITAVFNKFDINGDGRLSILEFQNFFAAAIDGQNVIPKAVAVPVAEAVLPAYIPLPLESPWHAEILEQVRQTILASRANLTISEVFRRLNVSNTGFLSMHEFERIVEATRPDLTKEHKDSLFWIVNHSRTGQISLAEFMRKFG